VFVRVRPVGQLNMEDDGGIDTKVICVLDKDPRWAHIQDITDVPQQLRNEIEHFFLHYKDLEPGKWAKLGDWEGVDAAEATVQAGYAAFDAEHGDQSGEGVEKPEGGRDVTA